MGWVLISLLALGVWLALWRFAGFGRVALQLLASALLIGIAGYALQGRPLLKGKPVPPPASQEQSRNALPGASSELSGYDTDASWLTIANAYQSSSDKQDAVRSLRARLRAHPDDAELWAGLGAVLVMHADGLVTPAAELSFRRAARLAPHHPGPRFFHGLSLVQAGKPEEAERIWVQLLADAPADAEWRPMVEANLAALGRGGAAPAEGLR
ncbi:MAG TPA: tetratricopeptide repeat protein [Sphingomicrobium sp.]|nr:tetratricopeptide repeat protein [Sphingomicrobium sp.]